ncbi:MAG: choice-of-anchor J domain-containing protein, partial [Planctomycetota bacterium]
LECTQSASYYFEASLEGGLTFTDPPNAPGTSFNTVAADDFVLVSRDEIEGSVDDWTVENVGVDTGGWEQADPNGTEYNDDNPAPENDATAGADNTMCFVTENGVAGGAPGDADLDGGPTRLISPQVDLDGTDGSITFARWHYSALGSPDAMTVQISNDDGDSWTAVPEMTTIGTSDWETVSFIVGDYIEPTGQIRVRFTVSDSPNDSLTESGIDNFQVDRFECDGDVVCPADTTGDGMVDVSDLTNVILAWGSDDPAADVDGNGVVDVSDLTAVILAWGACGG